MPEQQEVTGLAATMTVIAMGLGYSITAGDPTIMSANLALVSRGLQLSPSTASFLACLATLTLAGIRGVRLADATAVPACLVNPGVIVTC